MADKSTRERALKFLTKRANMLNMQSMSEKTRGVNSDLVWSALVDFGSIKGLAVASGVGVRTIQMLKKKVNPIAPKSPWVRWKLAKTLGVHPDTLFPVIDSEADDEGAA